MNHDYTPKSRNILPFHSIVVLESKFCANRNGVKASGRVGDNYIRSEKDKLFPIVHEHWLLKKNIFNQRLKLLSVSFFSFDFPLHCIVMSRRDNSVRVIQYWEDDMDRTIHELAVANAKSGGFELGFKYIWQWC